ncbi:hypothetical protein Scep_013294 [Stephania cephalantha]|uniref:FBD domain-containing protein n=1 Tax=Stephania cephalantha TaxID=152367 RepID=A0AAP0PAN0_9MAGN
MTRDYSLGKLRFLDSACIFMGIEFRFDCKPLSALGLPVDNNREYYKRTMRLLEAVHSVRSLKLGAWLLKELLTSAIMEECSKLVSSNGCMFHHLKVFEINYVIGRVNESVLLHMVLNYAVVLKKMLITLKHYAQPNEEGQKIMRKTLLKVPRASSNVAILFS